MTFHPVMGVILVCGLLVAMPDVEANHKQVSPEIMELREASGSLFKAGEYDLALVTLQRLWQLDKTPMTLFYIARCHEELGGEEGALGAIEAYEQYLKGPDNPQATQQANQNLERLISETFGVAQVLCQPNHLQAAMVTVEGVPKGPCPLTMERMKPGEYTIRVSAPDHQPWEGRMEVTVGSVALVEPVLIPMVTSSTQRTDDRRSQSLLLPTALALGASSALIGGGIYFAMATADIDAANKAQTGYQETDGIEKRDHWLAYNDAVESASSRKIRSYLLLGTGLAMATASGILFALGGDKHGESGASTGRFTIVPGPHGDLWALWNGTW